MRRFLTASICLAILFSGFGCAEKKGGQKASVRARGAGVSAGGGVSRVDPNATDANGKVLPTGERSEPTPTTPKVCENVVSADLPDKKEEVVKTLGELLDNSENEYVLSEVVVFDEVAEKTGAQKNQIILSASEFVDGEPSVATEKANKTTKIDCQTFTQNKTLNGDLFLTAINSFDAKEGKFSTFREIKGNVIGRNEVVSNTFTPESSDVVSEEELATVSGQAPTAKTLITKDGNKVYVRISGKVEDAKIKGLQHSFSGKVTYVKRPLSI